VGLGWESFKDGTMKVSEKELQSLENYMILKGYRGSIAHGTYDVNTTHDDKDIMGVFIPPESTCFGIDNLETVERMWEEKISQKKMIVWDVVYYSLPKYMNLILKQNPNILCLLWLTDKYYIIRTELGERLIKNRNKLISKQCYHSFCGYAYGQLHRMTHPNTGRMGAKRKELLEKFGYDTKNASHLIRLLKMGIELLSTGELIVERPDSQMLLEIKRGEWSLERVLKYSEELFSRIEDALIHSKLQEKVDRDFVNKLCMEIMMDFYGIKR